MLMIRRGKNFAADQVYDVSVNVEVDEEGVAEDEDGPVGIGPQNLDQNINHTRGKQYDEGELLHAEVGEEEADR